MKKILITCLCFASIMLACMASKAKAEVEPLYYYYGLYPQSIVEDDILYDDLYFLSEEKEPDFLNWYCYGDNYYAYLYITNINDERYFSNGQKIVNNRKYFFKCEKVEWTIENYYDHYGLESTKILDVSAFYADAKEYEYETAFVNSTIYTYLSEYMACALEIGERVTLSSIYLNADSIYLDNIDDTPFMVNLPAYANSLKPNESLVKECTDYALAKGINFIKQDNKCISSYWMKELGATRSKMLYVSELGETMYNMNINTPLGIMPYIEIKRR